MGRLCDQGPEGKKQLPREPHARAIGLSILFSVCLMIARASLAWGTEPVSDQGSEAEALVLTPVRELHQGDEGPVIIDATGTANTNEFPVSFLLKTNQGQCTWFLIGPSTLMTAAHCVSDNTLIKIEEVEGAQSFEGRCDRAPKYRSDPSQDWALCSLGTDYPPPIIGNRPPGFYEVLNKDPSKVKRKKGILITGFGCARPGGPLGKVYRVGWAEIDDLPGEVVFQDLGLMPNLLTIDGLPSYLCEGDSGGPAFEVDKDSPAIRRVIGINSRTILHYSGVRISFLASTSTDDALHFFEDWAKAHNKKICGLQEDAANCRPTEP